MREPAVLAARTPGRQRAEEDGGASKWPSGTGDLVRRHEPCVSEGPESHSAIRPDHQVGNAAVVEGKAEPAFWRELQRPEKRECARNRPGGPGLDKAEGPPTPDEKPLGRLPGAWSSISKSLLLSDGVSQRKELPGRCQPNSPTRGQGESSPSGMGIKWARGLQVSHKHTG